MWIWASGCGGEGGGGYAHKHIGFPAKTTAHAWPCLPGVLWPGRAAWCPQCAHSCPGEGILVVPTKPYHTISSSTMCHERKLMANVSAARFPFRRVALTRPRLPRHIAPAGARINLNRFWKDLEEFYVTRTSSSLLRLSDTREEEENCVNENLERERSMLGKQEEVEEESKDSMPR